VQSYRNQQAMLQQQLHIAADAASQQAAAIVSLEEQQRTQASDANDLLSVMNGMRETLSQQQRAISKLVAKRTRAEERATLAEQRCSEADARIDQHMKLIQELQAQLKDAAISIQLHRAVSDRADSETSSMQIAFQQKFIDLDESYKFKLNQAEEMVAASQERFRCELDSLRAAHDLKQQQMQNAHELNQKSLRDDLDQAQQLNIQLTDDLNHAQADAMELLQKCDSLRQSISDDASSFRSKLSLAAAAASQSHSEMVAAQQARATFELSVAAIESQNKSLESQIQELGMNMASLRSELEQQQQLTADAASAARSATIAQQIAESELQLEKEATLLHRSRADSAEKLLEESSRMRADVQVVFAAASDELADFLGTSHGDDGDASLSYSVCGALLRMLRHTRPVLVDPSRLDVAIVALEEICAATAAQAGRKVAAIAVAAADAMREADELRSRCKHQEQQLQLHITQSLETSSFCEQLQQMHLRVDSLTEGLEEEHRRHRSLAEEKEQLEILYSKTAAEAASFKQQHEEDAAQVLHMQQELHILRDSSACAEAASRQEISQLTASIEAEKLNNDKHEAFAEAARFQLSELETMCANLQSKLDLSLQETVMTNASAEKAAASIAALQCEREVLIADSKNLAADLGKWRIAVEAAEARLKDQENAAILQQEHAAQQLDFAQRSATIEIEGFKLARSEADSRITELSNLVADLQREILNEKVKTNDEKHSASAILAQLEADHAQLLRDCELLHAYQSETLQELQQLQAMYDQLLAERDEIEATAALHAEEQEKRVQEVMESAAAAESERAQLLQHLHISQQENLQLHRQQQMDEREKNALQSAASLQNEVAEEEAAAKLQELQVPCRFPFFAFELVTSYAQSEIDSLRTSNDELLTLNANAAAACSQLREVATRDEATISELQGLLEEQQRQQAEASGTMAAAEQQLHQISQRALQLGQELAQRQAQVDDLQVMCSTLPHLSNAHLFL
jgi:hypothetical protein